jgi:hypothetical protein
MATATIDYIKYHRDTARGRTCLHPFYSSLAAAGIDVYYYPTRAELTTDVPDGVCAIAMVEAYATFTNTRKVVLILTSPLSLLYAATLKKIIIHLTYDPINPELVRIDRVPKSPLEEGELLPPKPIPHTRVDLHHTAGICNHRNIHIYLYH